MTNEPRYGARLSQVDNLRSVMVAWVIGAHALLGYSAVGGWPYDEVNEVTLTPPAELVLTAVIGSSGLFVIGGFFFLAGLFTPASLTHKGRGRFVGDRMVRLGLPWAVSAFVVWPLTLWVAYRAAGHDVSAWWVLVHRQPLLDSGALWFALVLLLYSVAYAMWPAFGRTGREPTGRRLAVLAAGLVVATFLVRLVFPARGGQVGDLHLWQWPQCIAMFGLGIACARHGWARRVPDRIRHGSGWVTGATIVLLPLAALATGVTSVSAGVDPFLGGWHWQALATATAEGVLVVAGAIMLLGLAQQSFTASGPLATACARGAFAAFVVQGPVLVLLAVALRPVGLPAEIKAVLLAVGAIAGCFWLGSLVTARRKNTIGVHAARGPER